MVSKGAQRIRRRGLADEPDMSNMSSREINIRTPMSPLARLRKLAHGAHRHYRVHGFESTFRETLARVGVWLTGRARETYADRATDSLDLTLSYARPPFSATAFECREIRRIALVTRSGEPATKQPGLASFLMDVQAAGLGVTVENVDSAMRTIDVDNPPGLFLLHDVAMDEEVRSLLVRARTGYVPVAMFCMEETLRNFSEFEGEESYTERGAALYATFHATDIAICAARAVCDWSKRQGKAALDYRRDGTSDGVAAVRTLLEEVKTRYRRRHLPSFSIVSILYGKADQVEAVLESYFRQSYEGDVEIVFVDDCSPDDSARVAQKYIEKSRTRYPRLPQLRIVRNARNLGNCVSRNIGIKHATGDLIVITDADCMLNRDYLKHHADAHSYDDCEVVIGPFNLETNGRDPHTVLREYEAEPEKVLADNQPQDPLNKRSFLNCITRNFSIKADYITEDLFDPAFSYSQDPESGFGWEDVEMGYRLYKRGARIKYVPQAFTLHVSHPASVDERTKPIRSLRNFRRLFEKHPELQFVARRWARETYGKIHDWFDVYGLPVNEDRLHMDKLFRPDFPVFLPKRKRRLRILTYRWHVPHQYELYKLPHDFTLVTDLGTGMTSTWELRHRPLPSNAQFRSIRQIDPDSFDFAILHFDENVLAPENTNGVITEEWGKTFQWFQTQLKIPKVAICHGTPQFYGQYNINYKGSDLMQVIEPERRRMVDFLGDTLVIVNSHQAMKEWGFKKSKVIWHGFDPTEFPPATYEKGILSPLGPLVTSRPHYRGYFLYKRVFERFPEQYRPSTLHVPEPDIAYQGNVYAIGKFQNYVNAIRQYSVYFNPTLRSPMPRARGEGMLCGLATVSAANHDIDMFITNGKNGFFASEPGELREQLVFLMRNPDSARKIGQAGRQTACDLFNHDRFLAQWNETVDGLLGEKSSAL